MLASLGSKKGFLIESIKVMKNIIVQKTIVIIVFIIFTLIHINVCVGLFDKTNDLIKSIGIFYTSIISTAFICYAEYRIYKVMFS